MIRFEHVTAAYPHAPAPTLAGVDLMVPEGELCVVVGPTGCGKSTLLGLVNGHVPHFSGGTLAGRVTVGGRDTRTHPPRELAELVGVVRQDPAAGFVTETVEEELAYGMELRAVPPAVMRTRVEETLDLLGLADLRARPLRTLSGGQAQRVAIGAALTARPRVLVCDEPTSALDPTAAEEVLATLTRLVDDLGITVLVAEHRLERVVQYADTLVALARPADAPGPARVEHGPPAAVLAHAVHVPPVVELARLEGWEPVPLSVRDARRQAGALRAALAGRAPTAEPVAPVPGDVRCAASGVVVHHGRVLAVRAVDLRLNAGEVVALMGRNGSGKSSLLWALQGSGRRDAGDVRVDGVDPARLDPGARRRAVALVPQHPADLLFLDSVVAECARADADAGAAPGTTAAILDRLAPGVAGAHHPRDLSEGQRLALAVAIQLAGTPAVVALDEPTRGLDYGAKARLGAIVRERAAAGAAVIVATHDVEFAARTVDRVVVMAGGEVVADGPARAILCGSPMLAPQVAKVLDPEPWLHVGEVAAALGGDLDVGAPPRRVGSW
ncbi:MAG: cobalt ABC transporter ATP-binding protein [Acidimicrobiia bacterium]|nr:MAG: cobalt ABC transporter ATP-binding protein [Acidimicrobiia bacterium]